MKYSNNASISLSDDLLDLSITDIVLLQTLLNYTGPVTRFKILEDVNDKLKKSTALSPTKFYYSLKKLFSKNLITLISGDKKREEICEITQKGKDCLTELLLSLTYSQVNYGELLNELIPEFLKFLGKPNRTERLLVILPNEDEYIEPVKVDTLEKFTDKIYVITTEDKFNHFKKRNPDSKIVKTEVLDKRIREADNFFDIGLYIDFEKDYLNKKVDLSLNELSRIIKPNGLLVLTAFEDFDQLNHFILEPIIKSIHSTEKASNLQKDWLIALFSNEIFKSRGVFSFKGFLLGWGLVS